MLQRIFYLTAWQPLALAVYLGAGSLFSGPVSAESLPSAIVSRIPVVQERVLDGVIEAVHQATVSAQISGRVVKIHFDVDDYVAKGSVLLELRDKDQRARLKDAEARFQEADAEFKRTQEVFAKELVAKAVYDKAEARLKSAQARLQQAKEALEHTKVRAPYSGIVVQRYIELGETARVGQKLMTGLSLESLRANIQVPQSMIHQVRALQKARIILGDKQQTSLETSSLTISAAADAKSHTFLVRANLPQGFHGVYPGMFVKVAFAVGEAQRLVIPVKAVVHRSEVSAVYVQSPEGKITLRQVRLGRAVQVDSVEILAGLEQGEHVVLDPLRATALLKDQRTGAE